MSVIRAARPTFEGTKLAPSRVARRARRRWRARFIGGGLIAGTLWLLYGAIAAHYRREPLTIAVKRADLVVAVSGDGAVESADNLDLQNPVSGRRNIVQIAPDGSYVRKGDIVLRLDTSSLEEAIAAERAALSKAEAAVVSAKKNWLSAGIAVDEYGKGIYVRQRLDLSRHILTAEQRLASVEHSLVKIQIMFRKGWVSPPHVEAMELAVEKEQANLTAAENKRDVLDQLTRVKVLAELAGKRDAAAVRLKSAETIVRTRTARIARLTEDVKHCTMRAPRDGMVVYAHGPAAANPQASPVEPGAIYQGAPVRQSQTLVRVADPGRMQVKLFFPRDKLRELRRGQRAHIKVLGQELRGEVASIADQAEVVALPGHNRRLYAVAIALDDHGERLTPGMNAQVEILVQHSANALVIPLLCVTDERGQSRVRVKKRGGAAMREVKLGLANDALVEVLDGLDEGELVLLNPRGEHRGDGG